MTSFVLYQLHVHYIQIARRLNVCYICSVLVYMYIQRYNTVYKSSSFSDLQDLAFYKFILLVFGTSLDETGVHGLKLPSRQG